MVLVVLGLAWLAGIYLGTALQAPYALLSTVILGAAVVAWRRQFRLLLVLAAATSLLLGMARAHAALLPDPNDVARFAGGPSIEVMGTLAEAPTRKGSGVELRVSVDAARLDSVPDWQSATGTVLVQTSALPQYQYGDYLVLRATMSPVSIVGGVAYADYLRRQGISGIMRYPDAKLIDRDHGWLPWTLLIGLREQLVRVLERSLPQPQAGLAAGIVLGQRAFLSDDLYESFTRTNTSHVIAISGANISLVAALLSIALRGARRRTSLLIVVHGIGVYGAFVGFSPSVARAVLMGSCFAVADAYGRPRDATVMLVLAAALMTAWQPLVLLDLAFQLSFLATAGLVLLLDPIRRLSSRLPCRLGDLLAVSVAAEIATTPLISATFGQFSLVGLVANLVVPPMLPFVMASSGATAVAGTIAPRLGEIVGLFAWLPLTAMVSVVENLGSLPGAAVPIGKPGIALVLAYYLMVGGLIFHLLRPTTALQQVWRLFWSRLPAVPSLAALSAMAIIVWAAILSLPDDSLRISVLDIGQGDAILIRTPQYKVLVDGGPSPDALANALGRKLPFNDRTIDLIVLTHPNEDHLAGLNGLFQRFVVRQVLTTDAGSGTATYQRFRDLIRERGVEQYVARCGQELALGVHATLNVVHPCDQPAPDGNDGSIVLRLIAGDFAMLLTGDLGPNGRSDLLSSGETLRAAVLKVPHHGSADALDPELIYEVSPQIAIISVGRTNRFGHPAGKTLDLLERSGVRVYRTDLNGTTEVVVRADGFAVKSER